MTAILGIDIAKATYHATLLVEARRYRRTFRNQENAFAELLKWVQKHTAEQLRVGLEATGRYWEALAYFLHKQGHVISVINPSRISHFARSKLLRNKTDALDSELIAEFVKTQHPDPWTPPAAEVRELQSLVRHMVALQELRTQQSNRLQADPPSSAVCASLQSLLAHLDAQIANLEDKIRAQINQHPDLQAQAALLESIPGIAATTAARLLSENIQQFADARALAAYAGLTPQQRVSGTSVHGKSHLSKAGNQHLRHYLYFPAITAMKHNPIVTVFCHRLLARGKHKMAVVGAAMRKLLAIALGVLKSGKPFDPNYLNRTRVPA